MLVWDVTLSPLIDKENRFPLPLNLRWPCDLIGPIECGRLTHVVTKLWFQEVLQLQLSSSWNLRTTLLRGSWSNPSEDGRTHGERGPANAAVVAEPQ